MVGIDIGLFGIVEFGNYCVVNSCVNIGVVKYDEWCVVV